MNNPKYHYAEILHEPQIQLYAQITDLIPSEHWKFTKWYKSSKKGYIRGENKFMDKLKDADGDCIKAYKKELTFEPIRKSLKISWKGHIFDGHCRYWTYRHLKENGGIGYDFLPIDLHWFTGMRVSWKKLPVVPSRLMFSEDTSKWIGAGRPARRLPDKMYITHYIP